MYRTHTLDKLRKDDVGTQVTLSGWVHRRRDHGGMIFIDLRDRYGLTQIVSDPSFNEESHAIMEDLRPEFVIKIVGTVRERPNGQANPDMLTGDIEVLIDSVEILNRSETPPFEIGQDKPVNEE